MFKRKFNPLVLCLLALASQAGADQMKSQEMKSSVEDSDQRFLVEAAMGDLADVNLGQLGLDKAQNTEVKRFAQRLMDDHEKSLARIHALAEQQDIKVPEQVDEKHNKLFTKLSRVSGKEFDQTYMREMVKSHEEEVREFETRSASANDPDIKAWARATLPVLQRHLQSARDIRKQLRQVKETPS